MTREELREALAAYAHESWSGWMEYLFTKCRTSLHSFLTGPRSETTIIHQDQVLRWKRQMQTPYADLSEKEKESDREQADKILALLSEAGLFGEPCPDCKGTGLVVSDTCHCGEPATGAHCDNHNAVPMEEPCGRCRGDGRVL